MVYNERHGMKYVVMVLLTVALAGCGGFGGADKIDKGKLQDGIRSDANLQLAGTGASVTSVQCVEDSDSFHFSCLVSESDGSTANMAATCDKSGGGTCVWRPE